MDIWHTVVEFMPKADADAKWKLWLESRAIQLAPDDIRVDLGRGQDGTICRYSIRTSIANRINSEGSGGA
jgi:hypothetical protein